MDKGLCIYVVGRLGGWEREPITGWGPLFEPKIRVRQQGPTSGLYDGEKGKVRASLSAC